MSKGKSYACRDKKENNLRPGDFYPTSRACVWCADDWFKSLIPENAIITEPCCGNGQITNALKQIGYERFVENDLFNNRTDILHNDVLMTDLDTWSSDYVVTNFPFSKWDDCVKAFLAKKKLKVLITIGRLNYLGTHSRYELGLWKNLKEVKVFDRYLDYRTPEREDGHFNIGAMCTGWFLFTKEEVEHPIISFCDVQKYATLGNIEE